MALTLHARELPGAQGGSKAADDATAAIPMPRAGQESVDLTDTAACAPAVTTGAPDGIAYRGLAYGLLLALPFWIMVVALVLALR